MGHCIKEDGAKVNSTAKDMKYGLTDQSTLESMLTVPKMDLEYTHGLTRLNTMASGLKT